MERDVLLTISGIHRQGGSGAGDTDDPIEVITPAQYFFKSGKHYVLYDEVAEGVGEVTKNTLQFYDDYISVTKHGSENVHMVIESDKKNIAFFRTTAGMLHVGMDGQYVDVSQTDDSISVDAMYGLEINYEKIADCELKINIQPKSEERFSLA